MFNNLKKFFISLLILIGSMNSLGQKIVLRGTVLTEDICEFVDSGGYKIIKTHIVYNTYTRLSDDEFFLRNGKSTKRYILSDKKVDGEDDDLVIHYYASLNKEQFILGARNCGENLQVAIFPTNGSSRFVQYKIKLFNNKKNGRN